MTLYVRALFFILISILSVAAPARVRVTEAGSASGGEAKDVAVTRLSSRVITAVRTAADDLKVIVWDVGSSGALTRRGDATAGGIRAVAVTDWPDGPGVVTAVRTSAGDLKVIAWKIGDNGSVQRAGDASGGAVREISVSSPSGFAGVVTPVRTASGELKIIAWRISSSGTVTRAGEAEAGACTKVTATALKSEGGHARVATALRDESGDLKLITWRVTGNGTVSRLDSASAGSISDVAIVARDSRNADLVSVTRGPAGDLTVIGWSVEDDGTLDRLASAQGGNVDAVSVAAWKPDVHTYIVAALRSASSGKLTLIVWRNGADLKRHADVTGPAVKDVVLTTWSKGVVTAARDANGDLALRSWLLEPAGIRLLHREWPASSASARSSSIRQVEPGLRRRGVARGYGELRQVIEARPGPLGPDGGNDSSPAWTKRFYPAVSGVDPMMAVGHQYVVVTEDHQVAFFDREGAALPSKNGESTNMSATDFFRGFISATNPDGSPNPDDINRISPLEIKEFYDTRVAYDAPGRRFIILSAARKTIGTPPPRYFAFAVSKTEDPRDGFQQYMTTESNYRDFPRMTVHGNRLLVAHNAGPLADEGETPAMYAFDYAAVRSGNLDPPNWQYYPSDLDDASRVFLVAHHGDTGGMTFLADIRGDDPKLRIPAFPLDGEPWLAPSPLFASATLPSQACSPGPFAVFRKKTLYIGGNTLVKERVPDVSPPRYSVRSIRVPFSTVTTSQLVVDSGAIVDRVFGKNAPTDASGDEVTYDRTGMAVNKHGDVFFIYGRTGVKTAAPLFPQARYTVWFHGEADQRRSTLLQAGTFQPTWIYDDSDPADTVATSRTHAYQLDYATAVVDPVDDETFWGIHAYADGGTWKVVVGVVSPSGN